MNLLKLMIDIIGRALLSIIFIASAIGKMMDWPGTMQYFTQSLNDACLHISEMGCFQNLLDWSLSHATFLLTLAVIVELVGGLMVFLGLWARLGALFLILFLIPTTLIFHHFWLLQGPEKMMQMALFMKNVGIMGGLFIVLAYGKTIHGKHNEQKT